jgi:hypothetical protein
MAADETQKSLHWNRDWKKLTFYYFADSYINFNSLVTDLFKIYKTRIWMSAINPASFASPSAGLQLPSSLFPGVMPRDRETYLDGPPKLHGRGFASPTLSEGSQGHLEPSWDNLYDGFPHPVVSNGRSQLRHTQAFSQSQNGVSGDQHYDYGVNEERTSSPFASPFYGVGSDPG